MDEQADRLRVKPQRLSQGSRESMAEAEPSQHGSSDQHALIQRLC